MSNEDAIELKPAQVAWLESMADKHGLPGGGKAVRCLIAFAMERADLEAAIFEEIRCANC
jgi:hypothetical protein